MIEHKEDKAPEEKKGQAAQGEAPKGELKKSASATGLHEEPKEAKPGQKKDGALA